MYYYVYDAFVAEPRYERLLGRLETQANNLGLTGERGQVTSIRKVADLVRDAVQRGQAPIVIVGSDQTFNAAVNASARLKSTTPLAYIPVVAQQPIAELLGLNAEEAIVTLSRRIVRQLPLAYANEHCFVHQLTCTAPREEGAAGTFRKIVRAEQHVFEPTVAVDGNIRVSAPVHELRVTHDPSEGRLRLTLLRQAGRLFRHADRGERSAFWGSRIEISASHPIACYLDGRQVVRTPVVVTSSKQTVPVVVGRQRLLA